MKSFGLSLMVFGLIATIIAFIVPVAVRVPGAAEAVFNLQRGQLQLMLFNGGIGSIVAGSVLFGFGSIYDLFVSYLRANGYRVGPAEKD